MSVGDEDKEIKYTISSKEYELLQMAKQHEMQMVNPFKSDELVDQQQDFEHHEDEVEP